MIKVWTYAGYKGDEKPVRVELNGILHEVDGIIDRWCGEEADFFKVKISSGKIVILRHDRFDGMWDLEAMVK